MRMPLTIKGQKIKRNMIAEYGQDKGERIFYASENKGTITGVAKSGGKKTAFRKKGRVKKRPRTPMPTS